MFKRSAIRGPRSSRARLFTAAVIVAAGAAPGKASAASFDDRGVLSFDPNAFFTEGFESYTPGSDMQLMQGNALEGDSFVRIDTGGYSAAMVQIPSPATVGAFRFRAFVRSNHAWYPIIQVEYGAGGGVPFTYATVHPTGRMTDDGWIELESSPVSIDGTRSPSIAFGFSGTELDLDALEVVEVPGAYVPATECLGTGASQCEPGQFCIHGYCHDGDAIVPDLPDPASRSLVVDVLLRKIRNAFGGVASRKAPMQQALAALDAVRTASRPWTFWNGFARAIVLLHDAHTMPWGMMSLYARGGRAFPVCLVEGDADLSRPIAPSDGSYADVLVSHTGPDKNLGLKPGDRIVAVDGEHPIAWLHGLVGHSWNNSFANDPRSEGSAVESLAYEIPAFASSIQVLRCDPATSQCSPPETILVSSFAQDTPDTVMPACDHRPAYHLAANNPDPVTHELNDVRHGLLADSAPGEDLYGMIWNDTDWESGSAPWQAAYTEFRSKAKGLILDHRTGNGGTPEGAAYLTELSLLTKTASVWSLNTTLGLFDEPFTETDGLDLFARWKSDPSRSWRPGSSQPRTDMRIAVLLARDVSGSDFFPFGVKGAPNTRLFGRRTMGAFSTFFMFEAHTFLGWTLASGDFIDEFGVPRIGKGVEPDEDLLPKQSDLLVGRDTVYERALQWVRCGDGGCP